MVNNSSRRILVVDDDESVRKLVVKALEFEEYQVAEALSGSVAVEAMNEWHPHLILLDMNMPGLNGLETLRKMRSHDEYVSVLFLSGENKKEDVIRGLDAGAEV
jgi:two-component system OmpR family response regulator